MLGLRQPLFLWAVSPGHRRSRAQAGESQESWHHRAGTRGFRQQTAPGAHSRRGEAPALGQSVEVRADQRLVPGPTQDRARSGSSSSLGRRGRSGRGREKQRRRGGRGKGRRERQGEGWKGRARGLDRLCVPVFVFGPWLLTGRLPGLLWAPSVSDFICSGSSLHTASPGHGCVCRLLRSGEP